MVEPDSLIEDDLVEWGLSCLSPEEQEEETLNTLSRHIKTIHVIREEVSEKDSFIEMMRQRIEELEKEQEVMNELKIRVQHLEMTEVEKVSLDSELEQLIEKDTNTQTENAHLSAQLAAERSKSFDLQVGMVWFGSGLGVYLMWDGALNNSCVLLS